MKKPITDKDLITFLVACNLEIVDIKKDGNKSIVYFEDTEELKQSILKYVNRSVDVNIADVLASQNRVNTLLYTQKK